MIETSDAIGIAAAPVLVASVVQWILKPLLGKWLGGDRTLGVVGLLGVGYVLLAWYGDVIQAENAVVAVLLGLTVGVAASAAYERFRTQGDA